MVVKNGYASELPGGHVKTQIAGPTLRGFKSAGLGSDLRCCTSNISQVIDAFVARP